MFNHSLSIKLDDSNFLLWNQQVEAIIITYKLHQFVVNPLIPTKFASDVNHDLDHVSDAYQQWLVKDQMLFSWLLSSLTKFVLPCVFGCKHSYKIWDKIHKHYYSHLHAKKCQLCSKLKSLKKRSSLSIAIIVCFKSMWILSLGHLFGFVSNKCDPPLFIYCKNNVCLYVLIYVDDIIITGSSSSLITNLIQKLHVSYALKKLGSLEYFLGIEVKHLSSGVVFLS
uniref:Reverse transcriptase Ty1/copia-type domain-containing protein n=1 Tax=Cajanus cajan TaxID=3821 RepID=A0A151SW14_CAJCA|nr:hypothetical protein KK1_014412 [Cajanus cajan]